ncbi:hypothetical protein C8R45DRAFT_538904 [Mycena sanguinolenta]|nr:hypothetical protein C8R45DRAFT_538904 [Mycena sanguinolenta]
MASLTMFPSASLQGLIAALHFLGVTILTFFISRRLLGDGLNSWTAWSRLSWPRLCILLVFVDSYLFLFCTGILIFGVGLQHDATSCATGIVLCVCFYTSSKILIYSFLAEKVYTVWDTGRSRLRSPVFLICMATIVVYCGIIVVVLIGRVTEFRAGDGACVIGLKPTASIPLLSYDLVINILLTLLFLWPLLKSSRKNIRLRRLAIRTLVAAGMALTTSTVNIAVLTLMHGRELGWLCLSSCGIDVIFNAAALFWVTVSSAQSSLSGSSPSRGDVPQHLTLPIPLSPARSTFKPTNDSRGVFSMGPVSPRTKEFQIHVTTQSHVSSSPPHPAPLTEVSLSDAEEK